MAVCASLGHVAASSPDALGFSLLYTAASEYDTLAWLQGRERFPGGAQAFIQRGNQRRLLVSGFAASADPTVSFDGTNVLFAGKKQAADRWQIYEVPVKGGEARRVITCKEDCVRPFYLPEDRIVYARKVAGRYVIEATPRTGGPPLRLTYALGNFLPTDVLRDGRVLFEGAFPLGARSSMELYTVYSDGSGVESYRCDHGRARHSGKEVDSGDVVFVSNRGLARFTSALAHEAEIPVPAGEYAGDVAELPSGEWLLSWRPDSQHRFQLRRWQPGSNALKPVDAIADGNVIQPLPITPRPIPNRHPSGLHNYNYANLLCLNAYTSKYPLAPASIASVRLYTQLETGHEKLLGSATVEGDGSFYLRIPADQPVKIELLDRSGRTLKRESGWFWMRKGEQRVCVGCHAGPETAPENSVPAVLLRSINPADMTGTATVTPKGAH